MGYIISNGGTHIGDILITTVDPCRIKLQVLNAAQVLTVYALVIKAKSNSISASENKHCIVKPFDSAFGASQGADF